MYSDAGGARTSNPAAEQVALSNVGWAAILGLVGALISVVELAFTPAFSFVTVSTNPSGSTSLSVNQTALALVVVLAAVGIALVVAELLLYRRAFVALRNLDERFSTPATLTLLALVGIGILFLALLGILSALSQAITCSGQGNPISSSCLDTGTLLGLLAVLGVAGIVAFVGFIGLLIGIWRLGTRYDETMFKVGAILLIFPVLNLVALILILLAARSARGHLHGTSSPAPFGL